MRRGSQTEDPRPMPRSKAKQGALQEEGHWEAPQRDKRGELGIAGDPPGPINRQRGLTAAGSLALRPHGHSSSETSVNLECQQEPRSVDREWSTRLHQGTNTADRLQHDWTSSHPGPCLSPKQSIPGGKRALFLVTPGWGIYFK